jgi:pSer/pThr/pTyr-binding forkhead associated (FHA) protein
MSSRDRRGEVVLEGEGTNFKDKIVFFEGTNLVGRNPSKTTVTIKDRSISEIHGKIICKDNTIKIVDSKSKNGIYLNNL